jgi:DNA-binding NarL/FixJ family response regulator
MSIRVLIADDHGVFRSGLRALLEKEPDVEVVAETGDGPTTIQAVESDSVDVLILDITMPGLPGTKVAETVLKSRPEVGIVVLTMHEDEYYVQQLLALGVRAFVLKKSTGTDLIQAIRAASRKEQYVDPALAGSVIHSYLGRRVKRRPETKAGLLTPREQEVCGLLANGHTNAEISEKLAISERTVETHRAHIMSKLELDSRADLVRFAIDHGLLKVQ